MNNVKINFIGENDESIKFLGLHLDEHLTWTKHIAAINRVKYALPHFALKTLYFSLVQSHLQSEPGRSTLNVLNYKYKYFLPQVQVHSQCSS